MKRIYIILCTVLLLVSSGAVYAGDKSEKAGEVVGKAAKETKEAGIILIDATKKGAKKTGKFLKDIFEDTKEGAKDFKEGVKEGYKEQD